MGIQSTVLPQQFHNIFSDEANLIFEDIGSELNEHLNLIDGIPRTEITIKFLCQFFTGILHTAAESTCFGKNVYLDGMACGGLHNMEAKTKWQPSAWRPRQQSSWGPPGGHLGHVGPRWAPCWPHEPGYQGTFSNFLEWKCLISMKSVFEGPVNNIPALVQIMAWRRQAIIWTNDG